MTNTQSTRLAPGLYLANGHHIELIDADHECAWDADLPLPCWRVDSGHGVMHTETKREALAIVTNEPTGNCTDPY